MTLAVGHGVVEDRPEHVLDRVAVVESVDKIVIKPGGGAFAVFGLGDVTGLLFPRSSRGGLLTREAVDRDLASVDLIVDISFKTVDAGVLASTAR